MQVIEQGAATVESPDHGACEACGQAVSTRRIDWSYLADQIQHGVLNMDRGLLYSIKSLMLRPGHMIRDYIEGQRAAYVKPLSLLLILAAAVVFVSSYLGSGVVMGANFSADVAKGANASGSSASTVALIMSAFGHVQAWIDAHFAAFTLLLLPLEALAFRLAFHGVGRLNYPEWLVITTFLTAQAFVLWCVATVVGRWLPAASSLLLPLILAYALFSLTQFFQNYPRWKSVLRGMLGMGIYAVMQSLLMAAAAVVVAFSIRA